ncbi:flippase-like domain-containing protein [Actinotalea sp.]|uniref:flippase-like domain-containing protein n=1 Tax=Actinotalea sp. TaxID=1872145 RepID=UPI00356A8451
MTTPAIAPPGSAALRRTTLHGVDVVDAPAPRVHHPADLVGVVLSAAAIAAVCVLGAYAHGTTTGVAEDVRGFASFVQKLVVVPVSMLVGLVVTVIPIVALTELVLRRLVRHAVEAVVAASIGGVAAIVATHLISTFGIPELQSSFTTYSSGRSTLVIPELLVATAALLTVAGPRGRRRTLRASWNVLWFGLGVAVITGIFTLTGVALAVLLGRLVGTATRYVSGVPSERAYGEALVDGVRRAGFEPEQLVRVRNSSVRPEPETDDDRSSAAIARQGDHRVYSLVTSDGERRDVVVLDGDRQVLGLLARWWRSLRLRGIDGRWAVSLRQVAERSALLTYAALSAGVATPRLLGMAEAEDSMLLVHEHVPGAAPLHDTPDEVLSDEVLDAIWRQLDRAHRAGLAHRALTSDVILLTPGPRPTVLLSGWESGDVASAELARRMDVSQLLAVLALRVGAHRAVASAARVLTDADLATIGPLLQSLALPRATREAVRAHRGLLGEVREALLELLPEADVEPERLVRFGARSVFTVAISIVALVVVVTTLNFDQISEALSTAQPWWAAAAFVLGVVSYFSAALALMAFSPIPLPLWRTTLVQSASSFVALVAPAGVGPAALNMRMLTRRGVSNALAVASVGLVQVSQFLTTVVLLIGLSVVSGSRGTLELPSPTVLLAIAVVGTGVAATLLVPAVRQWLWRRIAPTWRQTWPQLVRLLSQPRRFALAAVASTTMTIAYFAAFWASLAAFGREMSLIDLAVIYLIGNAAGVIVPTPGGLGPVEVALIGGLSGPGGIPAAIATSVVVTFRGLTYWAHIPLGWISMRYLQRSGEL